MARDQDFISESRVAAKAVWDSINKLVALQRESAAQDFVNNLPDGAGANAGIVRADVVAVVHTTLDALLALLPAGHGTNLTRLL